MIRNVLLAAVSAALCPLAVAQTATLVVPTYAPVPSTGIGPALTNGFRVQDFGSGAYMLTDGIYQSLFFVANDSVIVVDAPPTIGHNILKGIRTITDLPISHMVYSHAHADHIAAAYLLTGQNPVIIAHEETARALAPSVDQARPLPNVTFTGDYELTVDNQTLQLSYKGLNHEIGNIFIYAPVQKVLMLVDLVYPGWVPFARLAESQSIPGWIHAHDQILEYDFDYYVGGHLNRVGTREDVLIQKEYVTDLYNNCAYAIRSNAGPPNASVSLTDVTAANPNNLWGIINYGNEVLVDMCENMTNAKWLGRLAGADVYGNSNAETMLESLHIDFGVLGAAGVQNAQ